MSDPITIGGEPLAAGLTWFLDTFLTPAVDAAKARRHRNKTEFDWGAAAERYRMKLIDLYGTLRVLGATEDIPLDNLFTDVFIFNELTARRRFIFQDLQKLGHEDFLRSEGERRRVNGVTLVNQGKNLYILGKPGAGKTTFLKYIGLTQDGRATREVRLLAKVGLLRAA